jgi:hypothetical protein
VAGYEVGIRVGEFLGRSHYRIFHTTGTAGTVAAAAAVGRLLGSMPPEQMHHAFGSAGTQAAGLWEFLRDAADSKQLHTAHAAGAGLSAAYLAPAASPARAASSTARRAWPPACRATPIPRKLTDRPGQPLGAGRDLVQVPRVVPPHPPGRRCAAAGDAQHEPAADRRRARHRARASGRDRRARARDRSADRAPGQVLDGHGARADRRARRAG